MNEIIKENRIGRFGKFGGQYVPETLIPALQEFEEAFTKYKKDAEFKNELETLFHDYIGRPTPLYFAKRLTQHFAKGQILFKREDLNHTGAHKINNSIGQALLAKRLGKKRIIAETGAGQHGVATATACALLDLECHIYMGAEDIERQQPNVFRMKLLGAEVHAVTAGQKTLKEAVSAAIRDWVENINNTHYILGSATGPHPFPLIVREFQSVIGKETKQQVLEKYNRLPNYIIACVGGGSNAIGMFHEFVEDREVNLIGIEAGGTGDKHAATLSKGSYGVLHGSFSYLLQDEYGKIADVHSISAGLDYPGVGPEHSYLKEIERVKYYSVRDEEALKAFSLTTRKEGILPALESSHALAYLEYLMPKTKEEDLIIVNISGRGDKDMPILSKEFKV